MYALLILEQNSSHCITVLPTSTGYFPFLPAMKRFTMLSVLCINSLTWLRTVTQYDCCRIQLPCLSGDWNHEGTQFRTRTKRFFRVDANNFKVPLQTFCRGCWISSQRRLTRQCSRAGSQTREWVAVKTSSALVRREAPVWGRQALVWGRQAKQYKLREGSCPFHSRFNLHSRILQSNKDVPNFIQRLINCT